MLYQLTGYKDRGIHLEGSKGMPERGDMLVFS